MSSRTCRELPVDCDLVKGGLREEEKWEFSMSSRTSREHPVDCDLVEEGLREEETF